MSAARNAQATISLTTSRDAQIRSAVIARGPLVGPRARSKTLRAQAPSEPAERRHHRYVSADTHSGKVRTD
jgi:hypothetical protein